MSPAMEAQAQEAMDAEQKRKQQQQCYMEKGVMLEPFLHQVGGHSCVLRFGEQTICKPLIPREHQFYKSLPAAIRKFTPQYRGVVSVSFEEDEEGNLCLIAYPLHSDPAADLENKDHSADCEPKSKMLTWGKMMASSLLVDSEHYSNEGRGRHFRKDKDKSAHKLLDDMELEWLQRAEVLHYRLEHSHSNAVPSLKHNPWSLKCHQQHLQKMKENAKHRNQYSILQELDDAAPRTAICFFSKSEDVWAPANKANRTALHVYMHLIHVNVYQRLQLVPETCYLIRCLAIDFSARRSSVSESLPSVT